MEAGPGVLRDLEGAGDDEVVAFDDFDGEDADSWFPTPAHAAALLGIALPEIAVAEAPRPDLAEAASRLRDGLATDTKPFRYIRRAAGFGEEISKDDAAVVVGSAAALIAMREPSGLAPGDDAAIRALTPADWLGAVVGLVRRGPGASARPADLIQAIRDCPEVDGDVGSESEGIEAAFEVILPAWQAAGAVDADWRLTSLGAWTLPRALARAWGKDL